jgi:hypothetical protein
MRFSIGGLALASILVLSSFAITDCSPAPVPEPAGPKALSIGFKEGDHGVLDAQTATISTKGKKGVYSQSVSLTPEWWVGNGEFKVVWYAGMSQTKRFFQFADERGDAGDRPPYLKAPEEGVRLVSVSFDGGPMVSIKPTTARALFKIPAGAKAVTGIEVSFGEESSPATYSWK